eukprot:796237-Lingulodinium_polyedra.AAC.1
MGLAVMPGLQVARWRRGQPNCHVGRGARASAAYLRRHVGQLVANVAGATPRVDAEEPSAL